jgi:glycosyltransferase involved in cell wall biosynthesis
VSVVVPAYADLPPLRRLLWSLEETTDLPWQPVVVCAPRSAAANRNAAIDRASQDLVACLDDDVLLPPRWLSPLVAALLGDPKLGAVSAVLRFPTGAPQMRRMPAVGELWDVLIPGTCFVYSRQRVGDLRFDEGYLGSQWDDTDWMTDVRGMGLRTVVAGDVVVVHEHRLAQGHHAERNAARYRSKWGRLPGAGETAAISPADLDAWRAPPLPDGNGAPCGFS